MRIYVGSLSREATEADLRQAFEEFGQVGDVVIIKDKLSGEARGFAFVEMPTDAEAQAAIAGMNGKDVKGRTIIVNEARERREGGGGGRSMGGGRPRGGPRYGGGGGGFGGRRDRDR